jgi:lysophospholipase L1-like esterase
MHGRPVCATALVCCLLGAQDIIPAPRAATRILFQGDSITDCNRTSEAEHVLGDGYPFLVAAKLGAATPERNLVFLNRGVSGNTAAQLETRWKQDALELRPDLLSILIGINDSLRHVPIEVFERTYDRLIAASLAANPRLRVVICEPFALPVGERKAGFEEWYADVKQRQEAAARLASKYHAPLVHFQKIFDAAARRAPADDWLCDGIHPTFEGHQLMADEWLRVVRQTWPE